MIDISIIVPVFNARNTVTRCLDSLYNQSFSGSIEVIAVDDGSTDDSLEILYDYKKRHNKLIIVEHKVNRRLAAARSSGMAIAEGSYVMHVDSDDYLLAHSLEVLYTKIVETGVDVISFKYVVEKQGGGKLYPDTIRDELLTTDKLKVQSNFYGGCWNKIVRRSLTLDMIYSQLEAPKSTEDLIYCTEILMRANTVLLFPQNIYCYSFNASSITQSTSPNRYIENQYLILSNLKRLFIAYKPSDNFQANVLCYYEKWIHQAICKIHFTDSIGLVETENILEEIFNVGLLEVDGLNRLKLSLNKKYVSLFYVLKYFGIRHLIGVIYRILNKH